MIVSSLRYFEEKKKEMKAMIFYGSEILMAMKEESQTDVWRSNVRRKQWNN